MEERILTYASELDGKLILSLRTSGKEKYSLLLDEDLNVIADLPQPCEAMPGGSDNSLIFDDEQGRLLKGSFVSLEDLRTRANPQ